MADSSEVPNATGLPDIAQGETETKEDQDNRISRRTWVSVILILLAYSLERISFHSVALVFGNDRIDFKICSVMIELLSMGGVFIGEYCIGELWASIIGLALELIGYGVLLTLPSRDLVLTCDQLQFIGGEKTSHIGLVILTLGAGLSRTNVLVLAAKQIPDTRIRNTAFFLWYYWFVNIGTVLAYVIYRFGNTVAKLTMWAAPIFLSVVLVIATQFTVDGLQEAEASMRVPEIAFDSLALECSRNTKRESQNDKTVLKESAFEEYDDKFVQMFAQLQLGKHLKKLIIIIAFYMIFDAIYEGLNMWAIDVPFNKTDILLSCSEHHWTVRFSNPATALCAVPFVYFVVLPLLKRYCPSMLKQLRLIGVGMALCVVTCFLSIVNVLTSDTEDPSYPHDYYYEIPQFIILELAEIFVFVVGYEFFYLETPTGLRSFSLGLFFGCYGFGLSISHILQHILHTAGQESKKNVFSALIISMAVLLVLLLLLFVRFAKSYKYRDDYKDDITAALRAEPPSGGSAPSAGKSTHQQEEQRSNRDTPV